MGARLGLEGVLYRNSGSYGSPTLVAVTNIKDLTLNLEKNTSDVTTRGSNGWRQMLGVLKDASVDFNMLWDTSDANFTAIQTAFLATTVSAQTIEFFVMSADVDESDSQGLRASFMVEKFTKNEPLEEAQTVDVTIRPITATNAPQWVTGGAYASFD